MMTRWLVRGLATIAMAVPLAATAQEWPAKQPIKIVVPFTAGSATDITARTVFEQVGKQVGQTFVVENRGGGGTTLGMAQAAKSDPDGYTMLVHSTSHVVVASTFAQLPFNVADDFAAVSALADVPFVIATNPKYRTLTDLVDAGKKPGSTILYGTAGAGSSGQLFMERFRLAAGFAATHVPFRGTPEGMTEVIAGRIDMYPAPAVNAMQRYQGRQGQRARGEFGEAPAADARRPYRCRSGVARRGIQFLGRCVPAGQDAEADHRAAQQGDCHGAQGAIGRRQDHRTWRRADADDAG